MSLPLSVTGTPCRTLEPTTVSDDIEEAGSLLAATALTQDTPPELPVHARPTDQLSVAFMPLLQRALNRADRPLHLVNSVFRI